MDDKSRRIKLLVSASVVAVALGGGISASRIFFTPSAEKLLSKAQAAYHKGVEALNRGDTTTAAIRFEEADLQTNKVLDAVAKEEQQAGETSATKLSQIEGKALWLKVRALRDLFVAKGIAEGRPLPQAVDSISGAKFYPVFAIPVDSARQEAFVCLREAARRLTTDAEVQRQALLAELMLPTPDWEAVQKIARQALQMDAEDPWALYLLARLDFEQPNSSRRSRTRVLQARQYLKRLKESGKYPLWRTLYLEAQIAQWLRDDAASSNSNRRDSEEQTLRSLLFAPQGALARAATGEGLEHPGKWDIEGLLGVHQLALDLIVQDNQSPEKTTGRTLASSAKVAELLNTFLAMCRQWADQSPAYVAVCALSAVQALAKTEPILWDKPPSNWKQNLDLAQELAGKAREQKIANPVLYETLAGLLFREAYFEGQRGNKERQAQRNQQALQWVEDGLRLGTEAKVPADQLAGLNAEAAEMRIVAGTKSEQVSVYLSALKESKEPRMRTRATLLEAVVAQRDGRLTQARQRLEQVLASGEADLAMRAHMVLGSVYLVLGQPDRALLSLRQASQAYKIYNRLPPQEKVWVLEFLRSPEDLALLQVKAHADSALAQLHAAAQRQAGGPTSLDAVRRHEQAIAELGKQFRKGTPQDRRTRQLLAAYYAATGRRDGVERELAQLRADYPNNVEVLRTEIALAASPRDAEKRIDQFIKDYPANLDARFFKVEWLIRMKRIDEALAYLQAPLNFADTKSERYQRVLAAVLLTKGDRQSSQKILEHLPHDAATDALLIQAASADDRENRVREALLRHEDNALFQSWQAVLAFNKRDYATAAEAFLRIGQYTRYEAVGKRGLLQSFVALAQSDPVKARDLALRLHKEAPDEPTLFLVRAYAALLLDEIGTPSDPPLASALSENTQGESMAAALNAWEQKVLEQQRSDKASICLTKSAFWTLAGRQDLALTEAARALNRNPQNPAALEQTILLALELRDPSLRPITRKRLDALQQLLPDDNNVLLLKARLDEWNEQPKDALVVYETLLTKDAKLTQAYTRLIPLLVKLGDKDRAWQWVRRWRKEQPDSVAAVQAEVRLLAENNQPEQARQLAQSFLDKQRDATRLDLPVQMIAALVQAKAWKEAENWLNQLLWQNPDNSTLLLQLAEIYLAQSRWDQARAVYEKVLAKGKNAVAANNLAWLLAKHFDEAAQALRLVQEARKGPFSHKPISPDRLRPEFLDTLGLVYTKLGSRALYAEMRDLFTAARQRYPHDPRICMYLGHAYAGLQQPEQAERLYTSAITVARETGRQFLTAEQCAEVIAEVEAARKKLKKTSLPNNPKPVSGRIPPAHNTPADINPSARPPNTLNRDKSGGSTEHVFLGQ